MGNHNKLVCLFSKLQLFLDSIYCSTTSYVWSSFKNRKLVQKRVVILSMFNKVLGCGICFYNSFFVLSSVDRYACYWNVRLKFSSPSLSFSILSTDSPTYTKLNSQPYSNPYSHFKTKYTTFLRTTVVIRN